MAYPVNRNRGKGDEPNFYIRYRNPATGKQDWVRPHERIKDKSVAKKLAFEVQERVDRGLAPLPELPGAPQYADLMGDLIELWLKTLTNDDKAEDERKVRRYLIPKWKDWRIKACDPVAVITWLDELAAGTAPKAEAKKAWKATKAPAPGTIKGLLGLLSRFYSWAIVMRKAEINPVRNVPIGKRPRPRKRRDTPWLNDDAVVLKILHELRAPVHLMFYLGNRTGMRPGEIFGLRLSDFDSMAKGAIRVRFSYEGTLKEDKYKEGIDKWVPAPDDCEAVMGPWLHRRRQEGAGPEDLVFEQTYRKRKGLYNTMFVGRAWRQAREAVEQREDIQLGKMTFYQATRHSFASQKKDQGVHLSHISEALNHSSELVTKNYVHSEAPHFPPEMRRGLGIKPSEGAAVIPLRK